MSRDEFVAVWRAAVVLDRTRVLDDDWYPAAVALTCRWLAAASTRTAHGGGLTRSPATRRQVLAYEELIEAECLAAEQLETRRPDLAATRPGWCDAVRATLRWAWKRNGEPPVPITAAAVAG